MRLGSEKDWAVVNLTFSSEQIMLKDGIARFVAERRGDRARRGAENAAGFDRDIWREMAELGWLGAGLSEEEGGFGGGPVETMIVMEAAGCGLMPEPLLSMAFSTRLLVAAGQGAEAVARIVAGEQVAVVALEEAGLNGVRNRTVLEAGRLSGKKRLVAYGDAADLFIVSCRKTDGAAALVCIPAEVEGVEIVGYRTIDGRRAADVTFSGAAVPAENVIATGEAADEALAIALDHAIAAACAEAVGVAQFLSDQTLDYLKTRQQFGQPIGRFQALQHRMADVFVALEEARSLALMATLKLSAPAKQRAHAISAAKIGVMARAVHIGREAIQLHGGVGMTDELPIGAGFKRLKALELTYGSEHHHLDRMASGIENGIYQ